MAHKNKDEIKAYYETNYATIEEVAKHFNISKRTIYEWVKNEEWIQGKHIPKNLPTGSELMRDEFGSRLTKAKLNVESEIRDSLVNDGIAEIIASSVAKKKSDEILFKAMSVEFLDSKVTEAVLVAKNTWERFCLENKDNPKAQREIISMTEKMVSMFSQVKSTLYGKNPEVSVSVANINQINQSEFDNLSEQELLAIIAKEKANDE